jgi:hypothetical protein
MLGFMSETTPSSEPVTDPVATAAPPRDAPPPEYTGPRRHSRRNAVAAWVGIVAGVVFIVSAIFFSGFILGAHTGGHHGHGHGHHHMAMMHKGGPPMGPQGDFSRPMSPFGPGSPNFGPGGPNFQFPAPQQPSSPTTTAPARP